MEKAYLPMNVTGCPLLLSVMVTFDRVAYATQ